MDDLDKVRQELESKLKGYVHPTEHARPVSTYSMYNEKGDDIYVTHAFDPYATFTGNMVGEDTGMGSAGNTKSGTKKNRPIFCPVCNKKASYECGCELSDVMCENGHVWYANKKGEIQIGDPHE